MADNEERILVSKWFPEHMSDDKTTLIVLQSQLNSRSMPYSEAIDKMVIAKCASISDEHDTCDDCPYRFDEKNCSYNKNLLKEDAEIMLDALLGDKNESLS